MYGILLIKNTVIATIINITTHLDKYGLSLYLTKYIIFLILFCVGLQFLAWNILYKYLKTQIIIYYKVNW